MPPSLFPSEVHAYNIGAIFNDDRGAIIASFFKRLGFAFARIHMKLQREVDGWVNKGGDRGVGDEQVRRDLAERKANLEMIGLNLQVPLFVLEHDRHFVGEALMQMLRDRNSGRLSLESYIEMMIAGQSVTGDVAKHASYHGTQCFLHYVIIGNQAVDMLFTHECLVDCGAPEIKMLVAL